MALGVVSCGTYNGLVVRFAESLIELIAKSFVFDDIFQIVLFSFSLSFSFSFYDTSITPHQSACMEKVERALTSHILISSFLITKS